LPTHSAQSGRASRSWVQVFQSVGCCRSTRVPVACRVVRVGDCLGVTWGECDRCWGGTVVVWGRRDFCGENIWISRRGLDPAIRKAHAWHQFGWLKPATAPRGSPQGESKGARPKRSRKADQRRIRGKAARRTQGRSVPARVADRGGGKVPDRRLCKSRRLPWSLSACAGSGLSDTAPTAGCGRPPRA
jgi:hypothetical protein